jgi:hypothetical protein
VGGERGENATITTASVGTNSTIVKFRKERGMVLFLPWQNVTRAFQSSARRISGSKTSLGSILAMDDRQGRPFL